MSTPLYSVGTWDTEAQAYTPQPGVGRSINVRRPRLRHILKALRQRGYGAWRVRYPEAGGYCHESDWCVLVERTDGRPKAEILEGWKR